MRTKIYACYNKNDEIRQASSSGGLYPLLAEYVLKKNGAVFAAVYDENLNVCHELIKKMVDIPKSQGAKYMQSELGNTFRKVKQYLENDSYVMFIGTPCQCNGLFCFLGKQYERLFCVDIVCHGVPSKTIYKKYLSDLENEGYSIQKINMRDKSTGWKDYSVCLEDDKGRVISQKRYDNPYLKGFISDLYLRPSCYECKFKGISRQTDITLGDYWGVREFQPEIDDDRGLSVVLVHSEKGNHILKEMEEDLFIVETEVEYVTKYNKSIIMSTQRPAQRDLFWENYEKMKLVDSVELYTKVRLIDKIKNKIKAFCKLK